VSVALVYRAFKKEWAVVIEEYCIAQNFGGRKLWRIHPSRHFGKKTLANGDNKSSLLVCTELIVA